MPPERLKRQARRLTRRCGRRADQIVEADRVVTRTTARGTHTGALLGRAPTGRQVGFELIEASRVGDGGITQHWTALDTHDLIRQLDAAPAATAA